MRFYYKIDILEAIIGATKPELAYLFAVSRAIQDVSTRKWTFVDLFAKVNIPKGLDYLLADFCVVGRVNNVVETDDPSEVRIIGPDGKLFASVTLTGHLDTGDADMVGSFNLIKFETPGTYYLKLVYGGAELKDDKKFYFKVSKLK